MIEVTGSCDGSHSVSVSETSLSPSPQEVQLRWLTSTGEIEKISAAVAVPHALIGNAEALA
jgi:hypothetical protein